MNFKQFGRTANLFDLSTLTKYGATSSFSIDRDKVTMFGSSGAGNYYYPNIVYDAGTYTFTFSANNNQSYFVMASNSDLNNAKINNVSLSANQPAIASNLGYGYARYLRPQSQNLTIYSDVSFIICFAPTIENYVVEDIELTTNTWHDIPHYIHNTSTDTITTLPAVIYANDTTATVGLKGNMSQASGVSPTTPIQPQECGERTGNLYPLDERKLHVGRIENDGTIDYEVGTLTVGINSVTYEANAAWRGFYTDFIQVNENEKLTFSPNDSATIAWSCNCYDENDNFLGKAPTQSAAFIRTFTLLTGTKKVRISVTSSDTTYTILRPMLNTGSTALPYEPYGYKIPISSANTTTPVYLGEVETTRKIRKLVLDGTENWVSKGNPATFRYENSPILYTLNRSCYCSHFENLPWQQVQTTNNSFAVEFTSAPNTINIRYESYSTVKDFKAFLATQYAAGTPVTVWYVLANEETGIVNEPIRKIGDYADTVSGITIPTIAGANTISVDTTLQPSEVSANYKGWHPVADVHEADNGAWT